jgi:uncharacterized protein (TIGR03032 family)
VRLSSTPFLCFLRLGEEMFLSSQTMSEQNQQIGSPPPPFSYQYSPNVPELLIGLNSSIAISTYQTGKVVIFSAKDENQLIQLPRNFARPMGMAYQDGKLALGLLSEVMITANAPKLALEYPAAPGAYDAFFVPRSSYYTGPLDMHDMAWGTGGLYGVNTSFSCLSQVSDTMSFKSIWQPHFIDKLLPEDRCHLNGLALSDGQPKYVTALGKTNEALGWKTNMLNGGILMDVPSNEVMIQGLEVPHSPRLYEDGLYMLLSATGELVKVDPERGTYDVMTKIKGFLRGMDRIGDYLFIAMSKLRPTSSLFRDAPIAKSSVLCGVSIVYIPTGEQVGYITYQTSVEELFDVKILPNMRRPNIMNLEKGVHMTSIVSSDNVFWQKEEKS